MARQTRDPEFPCSLVVSTPFPTYRLAEAALRALQVDEELSPLVRRSFTLVVSGQKKRATIAAAEPVRLANGDANAGADRGAATPAPATATLDNEKTVLRTEYKAKTNRMLRVAVNGFMESLGVVLGVMEKLDVDVLAQKKRDAAATAPAATNATATATANGTGTGL